MTGSISDWRQAFKDADALTTTASAKDKRARGRRFERILNAMLADAGLAPRTSYRPTGEEVDGSFWFQGRTFLLEAKWTADPHPASSLYQFKGKVDGKLVGTLGVFISIGGFSPDSVDALLAGKELNLILIDGDDIRAIVNNEVTFIEALARKLRAAGDVGTPFLSLSAPTSDQSGPSGLRLVIVEGPSDARYFESVRRVYGSAWPVKFVPASGPRNMVPVARLMLEIGDNIEQLTVIVDGDLESDVEKMRSEFDDLASQHGIDTAAFEVMAVQPEVEVALGLADPASSWRDRRRLRNRPSDEDLDSLIANSNLRLRAATDDALAQLLTAIGVPHVG